MPSLFARQVGGVAVVAGPVEALDRIVRARLLGIHDGELVLVGELVPARAHHRVRTLRAAVHHDDEWASRRQPRRDVLVHVEATGVGAEAGDLDEGVEKQADHARRLVQLACPSFAFSAPRTYEQRCWLAPTGSFFRRGLWPSVIRELRWRRTEYRARSCSRDRCASSTSCASR